MFLEYFIQNRSKIERSETGDNSELEDFKYFVG